MTSSPVPHCSSAIRRRTPSVPLADLSIRHPPEQPTWRDTTIIRDDVIGSVRALKAQPGGSIVTDGSSQLVHALLANDLVEELHLLVFPLTLGSGKRVLPGGLHATFALTSATPYPTGVVGLHYARQRAAA